MATWAAQNANSGRPGSGSSGQYTAGVPPGTLRAQVPRPEVGSGGRLITGILQNQAPKHQGNAHPPEAPVGLVRTRSTAGGLQRLQDQGPAAAPAGAGGSRSVPQNRSW